MKKTISINISGIIFHIEEDGYEKLKQYLSDVQRYFASYEDGIEITSDIENRIAEIFSAKITSGNQVITSEDVDNLITVMGNIPDFEAVADDDTTTTMKTAPVGNEKTYEKQSAAGEPKRLYRDLSRKVVGGVCSGVAAYFEIDPVWVRVGFLALFLNLVVFPHFISDKFSGLLLLSYIALWIAVPGQGGVPTDKKYKKLYRNPDNRTLGGVCSGLAAYFNTDVALIRVLFVVAFLFFGTGLLLYAILWISMPEAKTLTEKMEMQGEPVTLSNIEANVKKNIQGDENASENTLTKIVLFPFRAIAVVFEALGKLLGPVIGVLGNVIRIFAGLLLVIITLSFLVSLAAVSGAYLGLTNYDLPDGWSISPHPSFFVDVPGWTWVACMLAVGIPLFALLFTGVSIIIRRFTWNTSLGWVLFGLWIVGIIGVSVSLPAIASQYQKEGVVEKNKDLVVGDRGLYLKVNDIDEEYTENVHLQIKGYEGAQPKLVQIFTAKGKTREEARANAQAIDYKVLENDTVVQFDSHFSYKPNAKFRNQKLRMVLYMPYGKVFQMSPEMGDILENTLHRNGYEESQLDGNRFVFEPNNTLTCLTCSNEKNNNDQNFYSGSERYNYRDFNELTVSGPFEVIVTQDDEYRVAIDIEDNEKKYIDILQTGSELEIRLKMRFMNWKDWRRRHKKPIVIRITMPDARSFHFSEGASFEVRSFENLNELEVSVSSAANGKLEAESAQSLTVELNSAAELTLRGDVQKMNATVSSSGHLYGFEMKVATADVETNSAGTAEVRVKEELKARANSGGSIRYQGDAHLDADSNSGGSIERD